MSKPVILSEKAWLLIYNQLAKEYPSSYILIREKMKDKLGFVVRRHQVWKEDTYGLRDITTQICLDFYSESKKAFFLLKYAEFINVN